MGMTRLVGWAKANVVCVNSRRSISTVAMPSLVAPLETGKGAPMSHLAGVKWRDGTQAAA